MHVVTKPVLCSSCRVELTAENSGSGAAGCNSSAKLVLGPAAAAGAANSASDSAGPWFILGPCSPRGGSVAWLAAANWRAAIKAFRTAAVDVRCSMAEQMSAAGWLLLLLVPSVLAAPEIFKEHSDMHHWPVLSRLLLSTGCSEPCTAIHL